MGKTGKAYVGRLSRLVVFGPDGESIGRVHDVVVTIRRNGLPPRVLGLVVQLMSRRRIFVPMLRVAAIQPDSVTLVTGNVNTRGFSPRPGETLVLGEIVDSVVHVDDPDIPELVGAPCAIADVEIERTRTRDWQVSRLAVRRQRSSRLGRRGAMHVVRFEHVRDLTDPALSEGEQAATELLLRYAEMRPADVAHELRDLPTKRRYEVAVALDDERLADVVQELSPDDQTELMTDLGVDRAADILAAMDPDDAADLLGELPTTEAESLLQLMDPEDSESVRRLLTFSPDTAGGLMTPEPIVLPPNTTVAEALAHARNPDLSPALASLVFVVRPPTATPTGRYLGCVHLQKLLREPPANLIGGILDTDLTSLSPDDSTEYVARYFATYNLVCGPVVDAEKHLLGAVSVDDLLDHLLPDDWRDHDLSEPLPEHPGRHNHPERGGQ